MNYAYSPDTGEYIATTTPADWMEQTAVAPPDFDPATQGCFWRGTAWEVVTAAPSFDPKPLLAAVRAARELVLNRLAGIGLAAVAANDTPTLAAVMTARAALLDITKAPDVVAATTDADLRAALVNTYMAIVAESPAGVAKAFAEFDL